jgi:excisionase family DNA binding protein
MQSHIFYSPQQKNIMNATNAYLNDRMFYRVEEVCELFNVSERTVRQWITDGRLESFQPTRRHLISGESLRTFLMSGNITE